jgi:hypothetical protein
MAEEPLLTRIVQCPCCERQVPLRQANPRLYTVVGRESDRHVTGYRWINGIETSLVPHHYRIWQCPSCLLADFTEEIEEAPGQGRLELIRECLRDIPVEKHMVLTSLRDLVGKGELDQQGAIAIHLAAFLVANLPPAARRDHSKLGRIALRLAWLFRERGGAGAIGPPATEGPAAGAARPALGALVDAAERLDRLFAEGAEVLRELQQYGRQRGEELRLPDLPAKNPYLAAATLMDLRLQSLRSQVNSLQMTLLQDRQGRVAPGGTRLPSAGTPLDQALASLRAFWPDLPGDERQALRAAQAALEWSYQHEGGDGSEDQSTAQVNLILEILIRLGELERALDWTITIAQHAGDTMAGLRSRISVGKAAGSLSSYDETVINRKINTLGFTWQRAGERRREILEMMLERDQARIQGLLEQHAALPEPQQMQALAAAGIHESVLSLVSSRLGPRNRESPGWFRGLLAKPT